MIGQKVFGILDLVARLEVVTVRNQCILNSYIEDIVVFKQPIKKRNFIKKKITLEMDMDGARNVRVGNLKGTITVAAIADITIPIITNR